MDGRQPFGRVLKRFRLAAGLTHEALAERAGLGARTISDLERGVSRAPRSDTLALLIAALRLPPDQRVVLEVAARPALAAGADIGSAGLLGQLPVPLTSFVGREQEARAVRAFLRRADTRLVTLTGPGGVGKTRLAMHVAAHLVPTFPDGVVAVDLAPIADPADVAAAIGRAIGLNGERRSQWPEVRAALMAMRGLLVLDNCEHLLAAAPLIAELLRRCPSLKMLTTSRAALRLSGEQVFPVPPLPVPASVQLPLAALTDYAAVQLFVDRARRARPDFALGADNAAAVATICAQLDGLPLAIELAAARVRTLPPPILAERLRPSSATLDLLAAGPRDAPARQQTLRETLVWSYDLLADPAQALFRRLAVFVGGGTLEAVEAICGARASVELDGDLAVVAALQTLVDNSLVTQADGPDGAPRFRMLETVRAYAEERLAASGEAAAVRQRHAAYYLALVKATGALLFAAPATRAQQAAEQGNVQVALQWLVRSG